MMKLWIVSLVAIAVLFSSTSSKQLVCNGRNEVYACGSACQTTCENLGQPCSIVNIRCNDACYCKDGYARNCRGECIPEERCPGIGCKRNFPVRRYPGISRF